MGIKKKRISKHANFTQRKHPVEVDFKGSRLMLDSVKKTRKTTVTASKMQYPQRKPTVAKNIDIASLISSC